MTEPWKTRNGKTMGGKREGAGRKPSNSGRKSTNFFITEEEKEKIKKYIEELRKGE